MRCANYGSCPEKAVQEWLTSEGVYRAVRAAYVKEQFNFRCRPKITSISNTVINFAYC